METVDRETRIKGFTQILEDWMCESGFSLLKGDFIFMSSDDRHTFLKLGGIYEHDLPSNIRFNDLVEAGNVLFMKKPDLGLGLFGTGGIL